jgi:hypothetical protein
MEPRQAPESENGRGRGDLAAYAGVGLGVRRGSDEVPVVRGN